MYWNSFYKQRNKNKRLFLQPQRAREFCDIIDKIELMKKAILARAFRGELGTNDPSEESAAGLLQ